MTNKVKTSKEDRVQFRRNQIIKAGQKIFSEKGYHDTNISDIAAELNIGHGTFYRYFKNKRDIFEVIIDFIIQKVTSVVMSEDPTSSDTLEQYKDQVWKIGDKLMSLFVDDESISRLLHYESWGLDDDLREKITNMMDIFGRYTELYLINGRDKGFLRADLDTRICALAINAVVFEGSRRITSEKDKEAEKKRWLKAVTDLMFHGIS